MDVRVRHPLQLVLSTFRAAVRPAGRYLESLSVNCYLLDTNDTTVEWRPTLFYLDIKFICCPMCVSFDGCCRKWTGTYSMQLRNFESWMIEMSVEIVVIVTTRPTCKQVMQIMLPLAWQPLSSVVVEPYSVMST